LELPIVKNAARFYVPGVRKHFVLNRKTLKLMPLGIKDRNQII